MFLVIPFVEFLHVLGVDINVHHENPAAFLRHTSVSSMKRSRHRLASSRWRPVLTPGAQERHETATGEPSYTNLRRLLDKGVFCISGHGLIAAIPYGAGEAGAQATAQSERTRPWSV